MRRRSLLAAAALLAPALAASEATQDLSAPLDLHATSAVVHVDYAPNAPFLGQDSQLYLRCYALGADSLQNVDRSRGAPPPGGPAPRSLA